MRQAIIGFILTCGVVAVMACGSDQTPVGAVPADGHTLGQTVTGTVKPAVVPAPVAVQPNPPAASRPNQGSGGETSTQPTAVATKPPSAPTWDGKTHDGKVFTGAQITQCRLVLSRAADPSTLAKFGLTITDCEHF
jgi:hypothetical protein